MGIQHLLIEHRNNTHIHQAEKILFQGADGYDVYNISAPILVGNRTLMACRVEKRGNELSTTSVFESVAPMTYRKTDVSYPMMQDPSWSIYDEGIILSGTRIEISSKGMVKSWRTEILNGDWPDSLSVKAVAPEKMKDARVFPLHGRYCVFSRPQGDKGGQGTIGFMIADHWEDITPDSIYDAPLIDGLFGPGEWGGANEVHQLKDGLLGVLGHIAKMSSGDVRHYYAMTFTFDPYSKKADGLKIIAERADFPSGPSKRPDLSDVIFAGGLRKAGNGKALLFCGLSDCEAGAAVIDDPFIGHGGLL